MAPPMCRCDEFSAEFQKAQAASCVIVTHLSCERQRRSRCCSRSPNWSPTEPTATTGTSHAASAAPSPRATSTGAREGGRGSGSAPPPAGGGSGERSARLAGRLLWGSGASGRSATLKPAVLCACTRFVMVASHQLGTQSAAKLHASCMRTESSMQPAPAKPTWRNNHSKQQSSIPCAGSSPGGSPAPAPAPAPGQTQTRRAPRGCA